MKFNTDHIALLAGLVDEDDIDDTRHELAEGLMIERRDADMKEVSDRTLLTETSEPEAHIDTEVLREGVLDGTWDRKTVVEYLGFDPDPEETDDEHPEHPEEPKASDDSDNPTSGDWQYYTHATPGYECDPDEDPGDRMEKYRRNQEQQHMRNQLGIRGPGGQANESKFKQAMSALVERHTLIELSDEEKLEEQESLRETNLRRYAVNESSEDVTMGFHGIGFGSPRKNASYSGFGGEYDSGRFIEPGFTGWDRQIEEGCPDVDLGHEAEMEMGAPEMPMEEPEAEVAVAIEPQTPRKKTGFEDDPVAEKTFGHEDEDDGGELDLMNVIRAAMGKSPLGEADSIGEMKEQPDLPGELEDRDVDPFDMPEETAPPPPPGMVAFVYPNGARVFIPEFHADWFEKRNPETTRE